MSLRARRLSKSKDDKKLLDAPKVRERSRRPCILVKRGGAITTHEPVLGEIVWGVLECVVIREKSPGNQTINICSGEKVEAAACLITGVYPLDVDVVFSTPDGDIIRGKVPRVDVRASDEAQDNPNDILVHDSYTPSRARAWRRPRKTARAGRS